jgi:hypothetical protein
VEEGIHHDSSWSHQLGETATISQGCRGSLWSIMRKVGKSLRITSREIIREKNTVEKE